MTTTEAVAPTEETVDEVADAVPAGGSGGSKRSNLLPAVILAVGLVVGGWFVGTGGDEVPEDEAHAEEDVVPGELVPLDPMTLSLADGRYLRLGVAVELVEGVYGKEWLEHGGVSRYKDLIISEVGRLGGDDLVGEDGHADLKELLREGGDRLFAEEFSDVYLTELVVQ